MLGRHDASLSEAAWRLLGATEGQDVALAHPSPLDSLRHVRAKVYGRRLGAEDIGAIVRDVAAGRYSAIELAVLVDDIISTARTMIETVGHLRRTGIAAPVCIGAHGVFAEDAFDQLVAAGAACVVTSNTIPHRSNAIDLTPLLADAIGGLLPNAPPTAGAGAGAGQRVTPTRTPTDT